MVLFYSNQTTDNTNTEHHRLYDCCLSWEQMDCFFQDTYLRLLLQYVINKNE